MKLAVLCSDDAHHAYLVAALAAEFVLTAVIVEPGAAQRKRLRKIGRWGDWFWASYHHRRRALLGLDRYRRAFFAVRGASRLDEGVHRLTVAWINDATM